MELREYWRTIRKRWISIVLVTLIFGGAALAYSLTAEKVYQATAQSFVAVGGSPEGTAASSVVVSNSGFAMQRVRSYVELANTPEVLNPVIDELGLDTTAASLAGRVSAATPQQTVLLTLTARSSDPNEAAAIANSASRAWAEQIQRIETPEGRTDSPVKVTLTAPASVPAVPVSPNTTVNVALGLTLGLLLGLGWALVREQLDTSIKSSGQLSEVTDSVALGTIGYDAGAVADPLVALDHKSARAEAFRTIRTNIQYVDVDNPPRVIAVTSALPGEGKTTTACNLAIAMAQAGKSVVLVEGDLRRPKVGEYLGVESAIGLTNVLTGERAIDEVLVPWNRYLLSVMPTGPIPPNPSELLSSKQMENMIADLKSRFDVVVVDAAPLLPVTDGAIVASAADGAILLARYGRTTREQAGKAIEALERVDAKLLGVVLNFLPTRKRGKDSYGYGYGYGYGSTEENGEKSKKKNRKKSKDEATTTA